MYVGKPDSKVERQKKLLKGFEKVFIPAARSTELMIPVLLEDLRYYDVDKYGWVLEEGKYQVMVGPSSVEENLQKTNVELKIC
ncbi:MAG: fibronectin type III-like domain-contianing protein [Anaerolineaceae bacterium]|nr:fibronectin type III-like domain-contianing protein [Anaerolineaceae bacterium]